MDKKRKFYKIENGLSSWIEDPIEIARLDSEGNLSELSSFLDEVDSHMKNRFKEGMDNLSQLEDEEYREYAIGEFEYETSTWQQLSFRSIIIMAYSIVEKYMNELCDIMADRENSSIVLKDLTGSGLDRAKRYLIKVGKMDFPSDERCWQNVNMLSKIRNIIVHNDSRIEEKHAKMKTEILKIDGLSVEDDCEIILSLEYCKDVVEDSREYIRRLAKLAS